MDYYYFEIISEGSYIEGKQFLVEAKDMKQAQHFAEYYFPNKKLRCYGIISKVEADMLDLSIY